jgi:hypothetical protein
MKVTQQTGFQRPVLREREETVNVPGAIDRLKNA